MTTPVKQVLFLIFVGLLQRTCTCDDNTLYFKPMEDEAPIDQNPGSATFRFASYYGDHMVLQKAPKKSSIWGYANISDVGQTVNVVLSSEDGVHRSAYQAMVENGQMNSEAVWSVQLDARPAGGPYNLTVSVKTAILVLSDVLFGDVWLCGGQSNMVFSVPMMEKSMAEFEYNASSKYDKIRLFVASRHDSEVPLFDLAKIMENWTLPSPEALGKGTKVFKYFSATCWIFGRHLYETLGYPIGLLESDWVGTPDEAWSSPDALEQCSLDGVNIVQNKPRSSKLTPLSKMDYEYLLNSPQDNSVLWNGMIHPLLNLTIYGVIWYQGESDERKTNYNCTFPAMINDWRSKFHDGSKGQTDPTFPFGFVQLAGYRPPAPGNTTAGFSTIRWQQTANYGFAPNPKMPNTFMAVAMDLPDFSSPYGSIHPRDKETVGSRLAASGLSQAYNFPVNHQGPLPTGMKIGDNIMQITYDQGKRPINVRNTFGFELCCPSAYQDTSCDYTKYGPPWQEALVIDHNPTSVTISTKRCTSPMMALRYAWRESPCEYKMCAVYSIDNDLPAPPVFIKKTQLVKDNLLTESYSIKW